MRKTIYTGIKLVSSILIVSAIIIESLILISGNKKQTDQEVDYLIVLGARIYWDAISPSLHERLIVAEEYLRENKDIKVIVSGGQGMDEKFSEAYAMSEYLIERGISRDRIILEDKSTNTLQNLSFSLDKIKELNEIHNPDKPRVLIASNNYHILRSKILASRFNMIPYGLPAETPKSTILKSHIREQMALLKSLFFDHPTP